MVSSRCCPRTCKCLCRVDQTGRRLKTALGISRRHAPQHRCRRPLRLCALLFLHAHALCEGGGVDSGRDKSCCERAEVTRERKRALDALYGAVDRGSQAAHEVRLTCCRCWDAVDCFCDWRGLMVICGRQCGMRCGAWARFTCNEQVVPALRFGRRLAQCSARRCGRHPSCPPVRALNLHFI